MLDARFLAVAKLLVPRCCVNSGWHCHCQDINVLCRYQNNALYFTLQPSSFKVLRIL